MNPLLIANLKEHSEEQEVLQRHLNKIEGLEINAILEKGIELKNL